jgi:hypothetical protein
MLKIHWYNQWLWNISLVPLYIRCGTRPHRIVYRPSVCGDGDCCVFHRFMGELLTWGFREMWMEEWTNEWISEGVYASTNGCRNWTSLFIGAPQSEPRIHLKNPHPFLGWEVNAWNHNITWSRLCDHFPIQESLIRGQQGPLDVQVLVYRRLWDRIWVWAWDIPAQS